MASALRTSALLSLVSVFSQGVSAIEPPRQPYQPSGNGERLLIFNETTPSATIRPRSISVSWTAAGDSDSQYITTNDAGDLILEDIVTGSSETFVPASALPEDLWDYTISSDASRLLVAANYTKQYRHSYFADYFVLDVASGESTPLVDDQVGDIQYAELAPVGDIAVYVRGNNLFLRDLASGETTQVTDNGDPDLFNAVPDWVYEEEVFGDRKTLWFSPDAKFVAFLSFNETGVETFRIPYYINGRELAEPYPDELELRYPKVGSTNPTVQLNVLTVDAGTYEEVSVDTFDPAELIIGEVTWVTDESEKFIIRTYNRVQDHDAHVVVDPVSLSTQTVRERDGSDGWLENTLAISYVGSLSSGNTTRRDGKSYYLDLSDADGWVHIYLYPVDGGEPIQLTKGEWEVSTIHHIDTARSLVYYSATTNHPTERHLYKVSWATGDITPLVEDDVPAFWTASFSARGGYYILSYLGPDVPYQELYTTNSTSKPLKTLVDNADFYDVLDEYRLPNISYFDLEHPDGYKMSVMQQLPANFDPAKKYPVLFTPYGGPNSQEVQKTFQTYGWAAYIGSDPELEFITYTVDNRGTGYRGREYRSLVTSQLGKLEPLDQVWAAEELARQHSFIDPKHVGMWGWSYGGYLTAKTLEVNSDIFAFGLITAPVSDWRMFSPFF
jgi:dipeptidyl-peptidase-4